MCFPAFPAIAIGLATAAVGSIGAIASQQQQVQQVEYANRQAAAQADFQRKTAIFQAEQFNKQVSLNNQTQLQQLYNQRSAVANQNQQTQIDFLSAEGQRKYQGLQDQLQYQTELNKSIASQEFVNTQLSLNRNATSRAIMAEQQKLNDASAQAAFEGQRLLATNLQTQGTVLSSGRTGQSIGLLVNDAERVYGQNAAILNRNMQTAVGDYENNSALAVLRQLNADADATSRLLPEPIKPLPLPALPSPVFASMPEMGPMQEYMTDYGPLAKPVFASGPSSIGLIAGIGGSVLGGVNAGLQSAALIS
jgi:hypothetical protein